MSIEKGYSGMLLQSVIPDEIPRVNLGHFPTPLDYLPRLTVALKGPQLFMKRDDSSPLGLGGNKTRKLEFLLGEALAKGADTVITVGAPQSNHCRQTAAAAARLGMRCVLVLGGAGRSGYTGNYLMDDLFGVEFFHFEGEQRDAAFDRVVAQERKKGHNVYAIPYGGASPIGEIGLVAALIELQSQCSEQNNDPDWIVLASATGGTQAGLILGAKLMRFKAKILGISVEEKMQKIANSTLKLANATARRLGHEIIINETDIIIDDQYLGEGYGSVSDLEVDAIRLLACEEGILVDPVYTGRAFAAMVNLINNGFFHNEETVIFWHTGGIPALFDYPDIFRS